jgi:hypothetical protein
MFMSVAISDFHGNLAIEFPTKWSLPTSVLLFAYNLPTKTSTFYVSLVWQLKYEHDY